MRKILLSAIAFCFASIGAKAEVSDPATTPTDSVPTLQQPADEPQPETEKKPTTWQKIVQTVDPTIKFGGYIMTQFTATDQKDTTPHANFNLRLIRLSVQGTVFKDFFYRLQMEVNGQPGEDKGPRVIDAFVEWQRFKELRVKLGEFKRPFGFENPMAPLTVGHGAYSQATTKFLFNDRCGAHSTGGRDVGVQLQGDFFPAADGHRWLHYQVGFFNGQGINHSDKDNFKDLIGGLWISPVDKLRIGAFGWNGKYTNEKYDATNPLHVKQVRRVRWGVGLDYASDWVCRAEYYSSVGGVVTDVTKPDRSDTWYATVGVPVCKGLKIYAKWDCYRDNRQWNSLKQIYGISGNYWLGKHLLFQANYNFYNDRSYAPDRYYSQFDLQISASF